jgi:hypothetical protein
MVQQHAALKMVWVSDTKQMEMPPSVEWRWSYFVDSTNGGVGGLPLLMFRAAAGKTGKLRVLMLISEMPLSDNFVQWQPQHNGDGAFAGGQPAAGFWSDRWFRSYRQSQRCCSRSGSAILGLCLQWLVVKPQTSGRRQRLGFQRAAPQVGLIRERLKQVKKAQQPSMHLEVTLLTVRVMLRHFQQC